MVVLLAVLVGLAVVVALAVVRPWARGSDPAAASDPLIPHDYYASGAVVCALLTPEDLALATGYEYREGSEAPVYTSAFAAIPGITRCKYDSEAGGPVHLGVVYAYAEQVFEERQEFYATLGEVQELSGLGTRASWASAPKQLLVLTDDKIVGVLLPTSTDSEAIRIERARRLAEKAIERLQ